MVRRTELSPRVIGFNGTTDSRSVASRLPMPASLEAAPLDHAEGTIAMNLANAEMQLDEVKQQFLCGPVAQGASTLRRARRKSPGVPCLLAG